MIYFDASAEQAAKIKVVGVGGGGGNAINGMIESGLSGVEFIVINTDAQDLEKSQASNRLQIGKSLTKGLGAGANPEMGLKAIEEDKQAVIDALSGADMVFVTCGLGGGTGTGAAPIVAEIAKDLGTLTVGVISVPFSFEGPARMRNAERGLAELKERVDTSLVIHNDRIFGIIEKNTTQAAAFKTIDSILLGATRSISDIINIHGDINLDFADVKTVMAGMGEALMGSGIASGENRAALAAEQAINSPLLDGMDIKGAKGVLINITGGHNLSMFEIKEASELVQTAAGDDANIILGTVTDPNMSEELRVTVIATGFSRGGEQADTLRAQTNPPFPTVRSNQHGEFKQPDHYGATNYDELDKPTYQRKKKDIKDGLSSKKRTNIYPFEEKDMPNGPDELDIPAYIRKQAD
jgi:cell division protein FtsZ